MSCLENNINGTTPTYTANNLICFEKKNNEPIRNGTIKFKFISLPVNVEIYFRNFRTDE